MRQIITRLTKISIGYGAVQWAGPFLSLIFTPIITRILTPSDYGIADYILTILLIIGMISSFALPQAITAHFNDQTDNQELWHKELVGSALALTVLIGFPISLSFFFFAPILVESTLGNQNYTWLFQLAVSMIIFGNTGTIFVTVAQASIRVRWGMLFSFTSILVIVLGNTIFIVILRLGAIGMILVPITNAIIIFLLGAVLMHEMIGRPSRKIIKILAFSGATLLPTLLSSWVLTAIDRLFLVHYVSTTELGHYAIANKIASLGYVALTPIFSAWTSLALAIQHEPDASLRYTTMSRYLMVTTCSVTLFLGLFSSEILTVLTRPAYLPAAPYVGFLTLIHVLNGLGNLFYINAVNRKQLPAISWSVMTGAIANISLNFLLIPTFEIWGAVIATIISMAIPQLLLYGWLHYQEPLPYPIKKFIILMLIQLVLLFLSMLIPPILFPIRVFIKIVLLSFIPISSLIQGLITFSELQHGWLLLLKSFNQRFNSFTVFLHLS